MELKTAPRHDEDGDEECAVCDGENTFVLYENDKVCKNCGHAPDSRGRSESGLNKWQQWHKHRHEEYSGFYGEERLKFVGGFVSAWDTFDF